MKRHRTTWLLTMLLVTVTPILDAGASDNAEIDRKVDQITKSPDYDWLRTPKKTSHMPKTIHGESKDNKEENPPSPFAKDGTGCGYIPGTTVSPAPAGDDGCGQTSPGSCNCDKRIGNCDCGPSMGSCSPGCVGMTFGSHGYLMGAIALAAIIIFVLWSIMGRGKKETGTVPDYTDKNSSPEEITLSRVSDVSTDKMMALAEAAATSGRFKEAVGWTYLAGISLLHRAGRINLTRSTTNYEIVNMLRRLGDPHEPTARLIRVFEELFFGNRKPSKHDFITCKTLVEEGLV